jgi:predicted RNA-binding protein YlxR (DUF448 family)
VKGPRPRPVPMRQCSVCGAQRPKRELLRIVRTPQGEVEIDEGPRTRPGRGAYLCGAGACLTEGARGRRLRQRLGVEIPEAVKAELMRRAQAPA